MNIALLAHDNRKELMTQFCTAYCGILAQHTLCATSSTGQQISEATGLSVHRLLSFAHGGGASPFFFSFCTTKNLNNKSFLGFAFFEKICIRSH